MIDIGRAPHPKAAHSTLAGESRPRSQSQESTSGWMSWEGEQTAELRDQKGKNSERKKEREQEPVQSGTFQGC